MPYRCLPTWSRAFMSSMTRSHMGKDSFGCGCSMQISSAMMVPEVTQLSDLLCRQFLFEMFRLHRLTFLERHPFAPIAVTGAPITFFVNQRHTSCAGDFLAILIERCEIYAGIRMDVTDQRGNGCLGLTLRMEQNDSTDSWLDHELSPGVEVRWHFRGTARRNRGLYELALNCACKKADAELNRVA